MEPIEVPIFNSTNEAHDFASKGLSEEMRQALQTQRTIFIENARRLQAEGKWESAFKYAAWGQFAREALEFEHHTEHK
jgi:hypothetical protein